MKKILLSLALFVATNSIFAQREADETLTFDNNVRDLISVSFNGVVVISEGNKIHGYNPEDNKIIWAIDQPVIEVPAGVASVLSTGVFKGTITDFQEVKDTPFIQKYFKEDLYVINSGTGEILFEPSGDKKYFQVEYLFDENALLLRGIENDKLFLEKYSLQSKSTVWSTVVSETIQGFMNGLKGKSHEQNFGDKLDYTDDKIFAIVKSKLFVLDKNNGDLLWKEEEKNVFDFKRSLDGKKLITVSSKGFLGTKNEIELYDTQTGNKIWEDPIKTKYLVHFEDWQDKMLLAHYKGFNFYDYETGEKQWKKDPKGKGIKSVIPIDGDFLYVYDDEMMLIDKNGQKVWKNDVKICDDEEDPIFYLEKTKNNRILYITATYANLVDYKTGKKIWKGNLKLNEKRPTFSDYDEAQGHFIIYNDEKLYKFNETDNEKPKPYAKLKLKNEKLITSMELFPGFVTITGQSEVISVNKSGEIVFHNKYTQPGELGRNLLKTASIVAQVGGQVAAAEVTVTSTYRDSEGNEIENSQTLNAFGDKAKAIGEAGFIAGGIGQQFVNERHNALQENNDYAIIFAKSETGSKQLVKVEKQTGKELDKIAMDNNKPIYAIDYANDNIYYSIKKEVKIFKNQ